VAARAWVQPLLTKLKADESCAVITDWSNCKRGWKAPARRSCKKKSITCRAIGKRMTMEQPNRKGEPLGSGAMDINLSAVPMPIQTSGTVWSPTGDEALMCLETFRRNDRWHLLFPHAAESFQKLTCAHLTIESFCLRPFAFRHRSSAIAAKTSANSRTSLDSCAFWKTQDP